MRGIVLIPDNMNIDFSGLRFLSFGFTLLMILSSIGLVATKGLNFGIDFTGGTLIEVRLPEVPKLDELRENINALGMGSVSIQEFGSPKDLMIRMPEQEKPKGWTPEQPDPNKVAIEKIQTVINAQFKGEKTPDYRRVEFVGPQVGEELKIMGGYAIGFSLIGIMGYVWFRFEWQYGVASLVALLHDVIATVGFFSLTQIEFDLSTVAAILLVAGYSINDTVVIFDRIRDDLRKYKKKPLTELLNVSINQTLSRTTMTSLTTLLALFALYLFGGEVIRGFVNALIFGIVIGTYSSVFVAAPLLLYMNLRRGAEPSQSGQDGNVKAAG